tara:strand:- start:2405 stop:2689 length:285 start_codon:yes stop_codon:yes gene_type:complete
MKKNIFLIREQINRIIEMAWEDRTPFDAIKIQFGINEEEVIRLMRKEIKPSSFKMWRTRVSGRRTKHSKLMVKKINRFKSSRQKSISNNKISKR